MTNKELYYANEDILYIVENVKSIGWNSIKEQSIQRIVYLSKVLYTFTHSGKNIFDYYHFSPSLYGPFSGLIENSIIFLKSSMFLSDTEDGAIKFCHKNTLIDKNIEKENWIKTIILILGKYGENKIFGFTINDPLYKEAVENNQIRELNTSSPENKTVKVLHEFKQTFEETIENTLSINAEEYIDLYFEYVFSQIIQK
ncbi:hypothetical protein AALM74_05590 [Parabacteroides segnis]|uniref:hypothetical protein n=1 Tax=Parabacteroides segnis TaxID=2763058 RepID=UPI0035117591